MSKEQPIFGIDVHSEYQRGLNFERARTEGYEFCIIKAAEGPYRDGDTYVPTGFKEFFRRAEAEGFVMGVYHFLLSTPGKAQADHFLRTIEAVGGPEDKILMVDFEAYANPALSPGNDQLRDFIADVQRRVGDHPIVVYSGRGFWNGGDSSGDFDKYGADLAWDAYYLHMDPVRPKQFYANSERYFQDAKIPWGWGKPWGGVEPWFWQFTSAGGVAGMNIDVNAYRGTSEQLLALTGVKEPGRERDAEAGDQKAADLRDGGTKGGGTRDRKRVLTHGVVDGTNFAEGYKYVMQLIDRMKYWVWSSGPVPDGEGAYAVNRPLPPVDQLKGKKIFCAGVPNLFRRAAGKRIPTRGNDLYDGGIAAYFYTSAWSLGPGFFSGVDVPFQLATAKKWARETGSGVLIGRSYRSNSLAGQGHVAILLPDGKVMQSFMFGTDGAPGLNTDYTIEQSHAGGYYEIMVHPKDWINHDKGQIREVKPAPDEDVEHEAHRKPERDRHRDDEPYRPEPVQELTDEQFEEIGREILRLVSRLQQNRTRQRESEDRPEEG